MKNRKVLTIDEQIAKLERENRFLCIFGICLNLFMVVGIVLIWALFTWQLAAYFSIAIPLTIFYYFLMINTNKKGLSELRRQKESQLLSCEGEYEKEGNVNN